jgi:hypothetical protein
MGEELVEETETDVAPVSPKKKKPTKGKNASKSPKKPSTKKYVGWKVFLPPFLHTAIITLKNFHLFIFIKVETSKGCRFLHPFFVPASLFTNGSNGSH